MSSSQSQRILHLSPPSHTKVANDNLSTKKMLENPTKILHFSQVHCIANCSRSAATVISGWLLFEISLLTFLLKIEEKRNDHTGGQRYHRKNMSPHRRMALSSMSLVHNCTIFLCSLDVINIDDQCRGPNVKEKDHLDG